MSQLGIPKTYKLFIGGKFPRTESGRVTEVKDGAGKFLANLSRASRKDFREAVVAARKAFLPWAGSSAYLKGQICYRIAEILEGRKGQLVAEQKALGVSAEQAEADLARAIALLVYYAGWSDKYGPLFSTVNPVASAHFNFSVPEPTGVVAIVGPNDGGLASLVSALAPALIGGNSCVLMAPGNSLNAISFAEILATSDVPAGVVNILTGERAELLPEFAKHMDVNALLLCSDHPEERKLADLESMENLKRVVHHPDQALEPSPYHILDFQEIKTTWHPVGF